MLKKVLSIAIILVVLTPSTAVAQPQLDINSSSISAAVTNGGGSRGPALAVLNDGNLLLGGGNAGGVIFLWNQKTKKLRNLGSLIPKERRLVDSRFAITDIAVLNETKRIANLLISYPRLGNNGNCVEVAVDRVRYNRVSQRVNFVANWFVTKPCVPVSAVQHASGRFAVIDKNSAYVTIGDLGYTEIDNRNRRGDLGSIFKVTKSGATRISQGHRNAQGILLIDGKDLLAAEHGPRGGDELNLIKPGSDYGWPFVTYGEPYSSGDYVKPAKTGTHDGYVEPLKYWVPSIAPTELVQLPNTGWGEWNNQLALGTLREASIVFMKIDRNYKVLETQIVDVGQRIRDLEVSRDGMLIATTDEGRLLQIKLR